jgi:hypothetical protein
MFGDESQADEATPVLAEERDVLQVEMVEQRLPHPLDVAGIGVILGRCGFVAAPEADEVGRDSPQPGVREHRDHVPVEEAP